MIWRDSDAGSGLQAPLRSIWAPSLSVTGRSSRWKDATLALYPLGPVGDPGPGRPGQRPQTGLGRHQLLGLGGQLLEVRLQQLAVVRAS